MFGPPLLQPACRPPSPAAWWRRSRSSSAQSVVGERIFAPLHDLEHRAISGLLFKSSRTGQDAPDGGVLVAMNSVAPSSRCLPPSSDRRPPGLHVAAPGATCRRHVAARPGVDRFVGRALLWLSANRKMCGSIPHGGGDAYLRVFNLGDVGALAGDERGPFRPRIDAVSQSGYR